MAFDLPIEADRPEDLGFISSFVRAPVVGTIMWLFGGKEAIKLEEEEQSEITPEISSLQGSEDDRENIYYSELKEMSIRDGNRPNCVDSDVSDCGDGRDSPSPLENARMEVNESTGTSPFPLLNHRKRDSVSWSDASGLSLVEYLDASQPSLHEPASVDRAPAKSAMRRSRSITPNKNLNQICGSGAGSSHGSGIVMPTGGGAPAGKNGYISPQWGWYISTTPPTPEMYHSHGSKNPAAHQALHPSSTALTSAAFSHKARSRAMGAYNDAQQAHELQPQLAFQPPIAFTKNAKGMGNNMGWPSVPL